MDRQFEERLRQSLQARATDVSPDPRTWEKVQRRIDRQRTFRFASGAALATAAVAAAVVVGPSLLSGPLEIDLERAPADQTVEPAPTEATEPVGATTDDPAPPQTASPVPVRAGELGFVVTDGDSLSLIDAEGRVLATLYQYSAPDQSCGGEQCAHPILDFAVRPADDPGQITVVWRAGGECDAQLNWVIYDGAQTMHGGLPGVDCPGAPAFSPDGRHLAWTDWGSNPPSWGITVVEWLGDVLSGPPAMVGAPWGFLLPSPPAPSERSGGAQINIDEWVWTQATAAEAAGFFALHGQDAEGAPSGLVFPIERQADGALAVSDPPRTAEWVSYAAGFAAPAGQAPTVAAEYTVAVEEGGPALTRQSSAHPLASVSLPAEYLAEGPPRPWLSAIGDFAAVGDGDGRAWLIEWMGSGWGEWRPLPAGMRFAEPVALPAPDEPSEGAPEPLPEQEGLPHEVEEIREAIAAAARSGDIDQLVMLTQIADQFITSADGSREEDPRAFFTDLAERGELEQLATILEFPYGTQEPEGGPVYYVWPYAFAVDDFNSLSSAQLQQLEALAGPGELAQWEEFGAYIGPRIGIEARGAWSFYILGGD